MRAIPLPGSSNTFYYENTPIYLFSEDLKCPVSVQWKYVRVKGFPLVSSERACEMWHLKVSQKRSFWEGELCEDRPLGLTYRRG